MTGFTRRTFLGALLTAPAAAYGQYRTKPADEIVVDHATLVDIVTAALKAEIQVTVAEAPKNLVGLDVYGIIETFNNNLKSRGYGGEKVNVGGIFVSPGRGLSLRVGNQGVIILEQHIINRGSNDILRLTGHEFGHLYHKHGTNWLTTHHPDVYKDHNPEIQRLQNKYIALFNLVDIEYEIQLNAKKGGFNNRLNEKEAETMAVRQNCLPEVSSRYMKDQQGVFDEIRQSTTLSRFKK